MSKSVLYASNTATQTIETTGTSVNYGTVVRRYGCNVKLSGGNIIIDGAGYYNVDTVLTVNTATAGTINVQVYKDGVPVPGASASTLAVADGIYTVAIPTMVRQTCCCESGINVVVSGTVASTVTNASIRVEKV